MTFSERMYLMDQEAQAFNAAQEPCRCGDRLCYECGPSAESEEEDTERDGPFEERYENAQFEDAGDY